MEGQLITIFGATGLVGRAMTERLCARGFRIRAAARHPNEALFLKTCGGAAQVETAYADISDRESVTRACAGAMAVINCVGILYESTGRQKFKTLQAEGAGAVARAARKAGAKALVHISAIGADDKSRSKYARTKRQGEKAVTAAFPKATILRPSIIFGANDSFFNTFAKMTQNPLMPIPVVGPKTRFQPVYVEDVAEAAVRAILEPEKFGGYIYELGGPEIYSFRELLDYMLAVIRVSKRIVSIPFPVAAFIASVFETLAKIIPITPPLTLDQVRLLKWDNVVSKKVKGFEAFDIKPTSIVSVVPGYLRQYRRGG